MEQFDGLNILDKGLRLSNTDRELNGTLRFNNTNNKFEGYTGVANIDGSKWSDLSTSLASSDNLGSIKIGNNLFMNTSNGKLHAISVGTSKFYQHIVTVAKYSVPVDAFTKSANYQINYQRNRSRWCW